ncbi:hypothetical protein ACI2K4_09455 [Micromonospora sp. NPDC050397]|uniref:hypothetical protein n=1 Tax=Micromonospora sp. NPDC050397 TaxID=3364279 RepID=UPI00384FEFCA
MSTSLQTTLWDKVIVATAGRATLVYEQPGEQRLWFLVHGRHWTPVDCATHLKQSLQTLALWLQALNPARAIPSSKRIVNKTATLDL